MQHGTPIISSVIPFDSGLYPTDVWGLIPSCSQICLISPIPNSRAWSPMTSRSLFWDPFSAATLFEYLEGFWCVRLDSQWARVHHPTVIVDKVVLIFLSQPTLGAASTRRLARSLTRYKEQERETEDAPDFPDTETRRERLTIRIPARYHLRARQPQQKPRPISPHDDSEEPPTSLHRDTRTTARPSYVVQVHQFLARSTCSSFVRNAGGPGTLLAFRAFEGLEPAPTPTTPEPQTTSEALRAPDAGDWMAAMDAEIDNMRRLNVFKEVPRPNGKNIMTPTPHYENSSLTKHKARLIARGFTQISGVDYRGAPLYALVVRLESFRALISIPHRRLEKP